MQSYLSIIFLNLIIVTFFAHADENTILLDELKENDGWFLVESRPDSIMIYEKNIEGMKLKALRVEKIINFDYQHILNTVMDIGSYPKALESSDLTSFIVGQKDNFIYAYNHIPVPFPFIDDRHYFFKIKKTSSNEIIWTLVSESEANSTYKFKRILDKKLGSVYMDYGAGIWKAQPITKKMSNVSYSLYMDSGGLITDYLNDLFSSQSVINLYKGVLSSSRKELE